MLRKKSVMMHGMATKKRKHKLPNIKPLFTGSVNNAAAAETLHGEVWNERVKASDLTLVKDEVAPPSWKDIATLLQAQVDLLRLVRDLYEVLEDPAIAHVVEMKKSMDDVKQRLDDLCDQMNRHEFNYKHDLTDHAYYE